MKVIVVGATGIIGEAVTNLLKKEGLTVIPVSQHNTEIQVNIESKQSIQRMYEKIGHFDALVVTTGSVKFKWLNEITEKDYLFGLQNKLMGQINLVSEGLAYAEEGASFTLTSGILNREPINGGTSAAMVNSALEGFVTSACNEMTKNQRINIVSPTLVSEAVTRYGPLFKGYVPVDAHMVAMAYYKSIMSMHNGRIYQVGY